MQMNYLKTDGNFTRYLKLVLPMVVLPNMPLFIANGGLNASNITELYTA